MNPMLPLGLEPTKERKVDPDLEQQRAFLVHVSDAITTAITRSNETPDSVARKSGISPKRLNSILTGECRTIRIMDMVRIANACGMRFRVDLRDAKT